jgi:hypothetical protein
MRQTQWTMLAMQTRPCLSRGHVLVRRSAASALLGWLAFLLYALSFFLPATDRIMGWQAFLYALLFFFCLPMWSANPVFWVGLVRLSQGRYRSAGMAGVLAVVLALLECWMFHRELAVGYLVWVSSMGTLALAGLFGCGREEQPAGGLARTRGTQGEAAWIVSRFRR